MKQCSGDRAKAIQELQPTDESVRTGIRLVHQLPQLILLQSFAAKACIRVARPGVDAPCYDVLHEDVDDHYSPGRRTRT